MHLLFTATAACAVTISFALGLAGLYSVVRGGLHFRALMAERTSNDHEILLNSPLVPALSLVASVTDASPSALAFIRRLLEFQYGNHELIVALDGLASNEVETWKREFRLAVSDADMEESLPSARVRCLYEPRDAVPMLVVCKEKGGLADSLNAAVNAARHPLIGYVAPDAPVRPTAFLRLVRPMLHDTERIAARCDAEPGSLGSPFALLESLRAWLGRRGPGYCMLARREAVLRADGFRGGPAALFSRLKPGTKAGLARPIADTAAWILVIAGVVLGWLSLEWLALVALATIGMGILESMTAAVCSEAAGREFAHPADLVKLFLAAIPENLGYRQWRSLRLLRG